VLELHEALRPERGACACDRAAREDRHPGCRSIASIPIRTSCRADSASAR
jgi:hypothetical protein